MEDRRQSDHEGGLREMKPRVVEAGGHRRLEATRKTFAPGASKRDRDLANTLTLTQ